MHVHMFIRFIAIIGILWSVPVCQSSNLSDLLLANYIVPTTFDPARCVVTTEPAVTNFGVAQFNVAGMVPELASSCIRFKSGPNPDNVLETRLILNKEMEIFRRDLDLLDSDISESIGPKDTDRFSCSCPTGSSNSIRNCKKNPGYTHLCKNTSEIVECILCTDAVKTGISSSGCIGFSYKSTTGWVVYPNTYKKFEQRKSAGERFALVCRDDLLWGNPPNFDTLVLHNISCHESFGEAGLFSEVVPGLITYTTTISIPSPNKAPARRIVNESEVLKIVPEDLFAQDKQDVHRFGFVELKNGEPIYSPFSLSEELSLSSAFKKCYKSEGVHTNNLPSLHNALKLDTYTLENQLQAAEMYSVGSDILVVESGESPMHWKLEFIDNNVQMTTSQIYSNGGGLVKITKISQKTAYEMNQETSYQVDFTFNPSNVAFPRTTVVLKVNDDDVKGHFAMTGLNTILVDVPNSILLSQGNSFCVCITFQLTSCDCNTRNVTFIKESFDDVEGEPKETSEEEAIEETGTLDSGLAIPPWAIALIVIIGLVVATVLIVGIYRILCSQNWTKMREEREFKRLIDQKRKQQMLEIRLSEALKDTQTEPLLEAPKYSVVGSGKSTASDFGPL